MTNLIDIAMNEVHPGYVCIEYLGICLVIKTENGYINATHLCSSQSTTKKMDDWNRLESSKDILEDLALSTGIPVDNLMESVVSDIPDEFKGTYVHPYLVSIIAQWCSPKSCIRVAVILEEMAVREYKYMIAELQDQIQQIMT